MPQRFHAYTGDGAMEVLTLQKQNRYNDTSIDLIRDNVLDRFLEASAAKTFKGTLNAASSLQC